MLFSSVATVNEMIVKRFNALHTGFFGSSLSQKIFREKIRPLRSDQNGQGLFQAYLLTVTVQSSRFSLANPLIEQMVTIDNPKFVQTTQI
ncbi:MAG: hypothetical protein D3926_14565 [Desulfobacteraceae bacterium]|nr:MAG: hypothetical protein D3926_14565 [Desulfobacteraceae bacterium]